MPAGIADGLTHTREGLSRWTFELTRSLRRYLRPEQGEPSIANEPQHRPISLDPPHLSSRPLQLPLKLPQQKQADIVQGVPILAERSLECVDQVQLVDEHVADEAKDQGGARRPRFRGKAAGSRWRPPVI